jgi:hypothetical protein
MLYTNVTINHIKSCYEKQSGFVVIVNGDVYNILILFPVYHV